MFCFPRVGGERAGAFASGERQHCRNTRLGIWTPFFPSESTSHMAGSVPGSGETEEGERPYAARRELMVGEGDQVAAHRKGS